MSSQLLLEPFLNCDVGTGAWKIAEVPLGFSIMQRGPAQAPVPSFVAAIFLFPLLSPVQDVRLLAPCQAQEPYVSPVSSKGLEAEWKAT